MRLPLRQVFSLLAFALLILNPAWIKAQSITLQQGIDAYEAAAYDEAEEILASVHKKEPKNAEAAFYLGRISMNKDRYDQAIKRFEKAIDLDESKAVYNYWLSNLYYSGKLQQWFHGRIPNLH